MSEPKTIADFIEARRARANKIERGAGGMPNQFQRELIAALRDEADRLEAAWKREKAAIEADALTVGGMVEASRTTAENSSAVGNMAAMREALEKCANMGEQIDCQLGSSDATVYAFRHERCLAHNISECARAALAAPARNCDLVRYWLEDLYCNFKPPASVRREMPPRMGGCGDGVL